MRVKYWACIFHAWVGRNFSLNDSKRVSFLVVMWRHRHYHHRSNASLTFSWRLIKEITDKVGKICQDTPWARQSKAPSYSGKLPWLDVRSSKRSPLLPLSKYIFTRRWLNNVREGGRVSQALLSLIVSLTFARRQKSLRRHPEDLHQLRPRRANQFIFALYILFTPSPLLSVGAFAWVPF